MRLIVNADDLGYSVGVNVAILELAAAGRLSSTSLVVNLEHSKAAMSAMMTNELDLAVGIHLNLTRGRPCLLPGQVSSLVNRSGEFWPTPRFMARAAAGRLRMSELESELRAQIERALAAGIEIRHLDSHSHWQAIPALRRLVRQLARDYQIGRVRVGALRRAIVPRLGWLAAQVQPGVGDNLFQEPEYLLSLHHWMVGPGRTRPSFWSRRLRSTFSRPGVTVELVVHPGRSDDVTFPADTLPTGRRQWESEWVQSQQLLDWISFMQGELVGGGNEGAHGAPAGVISS